MARLVTLSAPWRCAVPMQSAPVSPPPMTTTCLPSAVIWSGTVSPATDLVRLHQVLHGEVHAEQVAAGDRQVARHRGAGGDHDGVVARPQVVPGDVLADLDAGAEAGALGLHLREPQLEVLLLHLEVGDAVAQQAADAVVALEDGDGVAGAGQLLRGGEAGGAGADDGDGLAGEALGRVRGRPSRSRTPGR